MTDDRLLRQGVVIARSADYMDIQVNAPCQTCETTCGFGRLAAPGIIARVSCTQTVGEGQSIVLSASRRGLTRLAATLFLPAIGVFIAVMLMAASGAADYLVAVIGSVALVLALLYGSFSARLGDRWLDIETAVPIENSSRVRP